MCRFPPSQRFYKTALVWTLPQTMQVIPSILCSPNTPSTFGPLFLPLLFTLLTVLFCPLPCVCAQSGPTLRHSMNWSLLGSSVHGISRKDHWSGLPFPSPEDLPNPGIEPRFPTWQANRQYSGEFHELYSPRGGNELDMTEQLSLSPTIFSKSCSLSWWCYLTILSSATPFSFCLQSFPASGSFPVSRLLKWM